MHLTLKTEATRPAAANVLQQQAPLRYFVRSVQSRAPAPGARHADAGESLSPVSARVSRPGGARLSVSRLDRRRDATAAGSASTGRKINVSQVFAGQKVGVKQVDEHIWLVTFMDYDLGYFDDETCRLEPIDNPFGPKLLPMSPE